MPAAARAAAAARRDRHRERLPLHRLLEHQLRRLHLHRRRRRRPRPRRVHVRRVPRPRRPDVRHRPVHRHLHPRAAQRHQYRRVVQLRLRDGARRRARRGGVPGDDPQRRLAEERADVGGVVAGGEVVDQARVDGLRRVDVAGADGVEPRLPVLLVHDGVAVVVHGAGRRHDRRLDHRRRPVRVELLDERHDAGDVRRRHGRAGDDVEVVGLAAALADGHLRRPRGEDVQPRRHDVRLRHAGARRARPARREGGDHRSRLDADHRAVEHDRRVVGRGRRPHRGVSHDLGAVAGGHLRHGEAVVLLDDDGVPEVRLVDEHHAGAAGLLDRVD
ncbi:Os05g0368666 [Oryza sativa Japonica Group]|uniref:Os05g0368666 protein n=1 Tax=Oryza sativa subsp. japonica TaxID=39947 RepID=A0A0N7KKM9_ORYSJ|nr:Os05g0368666 [Oryza sativa Japonica Group]